jgi:phosphoserine phosphatase
MHKGVSRLLAGLWLALLVVASPALTSPAAAREALASWADGPAKQAVTEFVREVTREGGPKFVPKGERVAVFDNDGTLWVEQPVYTQLRYVLAQVPAVVKKNPELANAEPFRTVLSGDRAAIAKLPLEELGKLVMATSTGMTPAEFEAQADAWMAAAKDSRFGKPYTQLTYAPMREMMDYLRGHGFDVWIVTGGGQDFVRSFATEAYGVPRDHVIGTATAVRYGYDAAGKPTLVKEPKVLINDNDAGKPEAIELFIGRRPILAFGNSDGDKQMLEYASSGTPGMSLIVLHDDAAREYAYGPAAGLPDSKVGTFTQALYDEARAKGWTVISMKDDWKQVFSDK